MEANYKGKKFTHEDVLKGMDEFDRTRRATFSAWRLYAIRHNEQNYPPKELLRIIVGDISGTSGGEPTNKYFRQLGFPIVKLTDDDEASSTLEEESEEFQFSFERDLEETLAVNLADLEPGLRLYEQGNIKGRQIDAGEIGRIDILAVAHDGALVVIELKAGEAGDRVCAQILRYMGWVKEALGEGREVRGILVASDFTTRLRYAAKPVPSLQLKRYRVHFEFEDV